VRVLLFAGGGGAGTTTVAAATAVTAARAGIKTLLLSTDRASSLTDVLQRAPQGSAAGGEHRPTREVEPGLAVLRVDPPAVSATVERYVKHLPAGLGVGDLATVDLLALPGASEIVTLALLREQVSSGPWDLVVADVAGGGAAQRLLSAPDTALRLLDGQLPTERLLGLRRHGPSRLLARAVAGLREELCAARDVLRARTTSVRLVLAPQSLGLTQARRAFTALTVHGFVVDGVIANRVVANRAVAQDRVLAEADESFAPLRVRRLPQLPAEPIGPDALAALGTTLLEGQAGLTGEVERLLAAPVAATGPQVRRTADGFDMVLAAPFVTAPDVQLSRDDDQLRLRVQGTEAVVALPAVLRRCVATGAEVRAGRVVVRFRPDADLWPSRHRSDDATTIEGQA
jgi:arsenite-transporting ATPase